MRTMATTGLATGPTAPRQVHLLLVLVLLGYLGLLAFCSSAMVMDIPAPDERSVDVVGAEMGMVSPPVVCAAGTGDCLLTLTPPVSLFKSSHVLALPAAVGIGFLLEGRASLEPGRHALDPPGGAKLQVLLQVFRL